MFRLTSSYLQALIQLHIHTKMHKIYTLINKTTVKTGTPILSKSTIIPTNTWGYHTRHKIESTISTILLTQILFMYTHTHTYVCVCVCVCVHIYINAYFEDDWCESKYVHVILFLLNKFTFAHTLLLFCTKAVRSACNPEAMQHSPYATLAHSAVPGTQRGVTGRPRQVTQFYIHS